jgi:hypothetical protein
MLIAPSTSKEFQTLAVLLRITRKKTNHACIYSSLLQGDLKSLKNMGCSR